MVEFLQCIFTVGVIYQVTSIISESSFPIFSWLRKRNGIIGNLFDCFLCVSVWIGWIGSYFLFNLGNELGFIEYSWFTSGLFYSFICWFIHLLEGKLS